jgi:Fe-S-cluster formation regulator IscX/YfhJ
MSATLNAENLRRWAMQCEDQANDPRASGYKRTRFMKMRESLLVLADEDDFSRRAKRMPDPQQG